MKNSLNHDNKSSLNRTAISATLHCMTGCAIGEILGMVIGTSMGLGNWTTVGISVGLAFLFGYSLTLLPLVRAGIGLGLALQLAFAADTVSITVMEIVDNLVMLLIPGAMESGPTTFLFWGSMTLAMVLAGLAAFPFVKWLIARGQGHAVVHQYHGHTSSDNTRKNEEETAEHSHIHPH